MVASDTRDPSRGHKRGHRRSRVGSSIVAIASINQVGYFAGGNAHPIAFWPLFAPLLIQDEYARPAPLWSGASVMGLDFQGVKVLIVSFKELEA